MHRKALFAGVATALLLAATLPRGWKVVAVDDAAGAARADLVPVDRGH